MDRGSARSARGDERLLPRVLVGPVDDRTCWPAGALAFGRRVTRRAQRLLLDRDQRRRRRDETRTAPRHAEQRSRRRRGRARSASAPPAAPRRARRARSPRPSRHRASTPLNACRPRRRRPRQRPPSRPARAPPSPRRDGAGRRAASASDAVGTTTSVGPSAIADSTDGSTSLRGGSRSTPPPAASSRAWPVTTVQAHGASVRERQRRDGSFRGCGDEERPDRRAAQRTCAHSASSIRSSDGPCPVTFAIGLRPSTVDRGLADAGSTTQPPMRRPCRSTRTIVPIARRRRRVASGSSSRTPCRAR